MAIKTKHLWDPRLLTEDQLIGQKKLRRGFLLYTVIVFLPFVGIIAYAAVKDPSIALQLFWATLIKSWMTYPLLLLFLISPYRVLRGSNEARTLSGVIALILAMLMIPGLLAFFSGSLAGIICGIVCLVAFPIFCYLTNIFLICEKVKDFVGVIRSRRGLSSESWKLDD